MSVSEGLSQEEFLALQEQLLTLRNQNYELQDALRRSKAEQANNSNSTKNEAILFATKLINRNKDKECHSSKCGGEIEELRKKLIDQEEAFRLQQETLFAELKEISSKNDKLESKVKLIDAGESHVNPAASDPLSKAPCNCSTLEQSVIEMKENIDKLSIKESNMNNILLEKETLIKALEDQLLDYKEKKDNSLRKLEEQEQLVAVIQDHLTAREKEDEEKIKKHEELLSQFNATLTTLKQIETLNNSLTEEKNKRDATESESTLRIQTLLAEIEDLKKNLAAHNNEISKLREVEATSNSLVAEKNSELDDLRVQLIDKSEEQSKLQNLYEEKIRKLERKMEDLKLNYETKLEESASISTKREAELKESLENLENNSTKEMEEKLLLLETRLQLELSDQQKQFEIERSGLQQKISFLEDAIAGKNEEKNLALKKQSALLKELQKALVEEKKRADNLEKGKGERDGWHVVEADARDTQTLDGNDSVSSISALESDNAELINRLSSMHKVYSDSTEKIIVLESENARLHKEVMEKNELIEHWIKNKPVSVSAPSSNTKQEGVLRKLLTSLPTNESANDIKEMNKKLQRMLEETLSKNIILQRDIQTLLERTEI